MSAARGPGRPPDFLIIGAQKCGTTWLHHHLRQSEDVFMPPDKDHEHFSYLGNLNAEAFARYCRRFAGARADQSAGDANAAYFWTRTGSPWSPQPESFNPDIPRTVLRYLGPELRLIVMLRDPVERAISAYLHHIRHGAISTADSILEPALPLGIIDMSLFRIHLANWLEAYPAENLLILPRLPDSDSRAKAVVERACAHLGVAAPRADQYHFEPIFPGIRRREDTSGVWIAADAGEAPPRGLAEREIDGERFIQVVSAAELARLHEILDEHRVG